MQDLYLLNLVVLVFAAFTHVQDLNTSSSIDSQPQKPSCVIRKKNLRLDLIWFKPFLYEEETYYTGYKLLDQFISLSLNTEYIIFIYLG